ncbi:macrolide ABC transporter ATP-binding protein [Nitrosopumilus zosterae]|uniref:Macrolide ABC transporter ATP-binding protein n=1 Tax=Nitrosopumilus zosterae TaxID=718286 RepID=A0A2S2KSJ3_9ARCH|nr:ABC transporter ATP-binding protein [Nitrosopumilus zosterae]BDQ30759.1 ABC transporter ATP-binding protein [Nitrosopumilus zosterae]GBH34626.1 macrolide ABC transporter ATP-binding protein [Nitrosopumilus zosterae]
MSSMSQTVKQVHGILDVQNVSKVYQTAAGKVVALKNVSFSIPKNQFVSIVGPSGSGKSTLLNMIGALDKPSRGTVLMDGIDIFKLPDNKLAKIRNTKIGFVFQSFNLINRSTVQKNIEMPGIISGMDNATRTKRAQSILKKLGILKKANHKPNNLSGGEQQRVAIGRALINNPAIILADEPTGNLDTATGEDIFQLLTELTKKYSRTVVMITHNVDLAKRTDRSIYMKDGEIEKDVCN